MTIKSDIEAVERLLSRKQSVPTQMIHALLIDLKTIYALSKKQAETISDLKAEAHDAEEVKLNNSRSRQWDNLTEAQP